MKVRKITIATASLVLIMVLSMGCRHRREVVYVNGTPPATTVVYNNTPPPNNTVVYNNQQPIAPAVIVSSPVNNHTSVWNFITVRGSVQNIQSAPQITISQNGYPVKHFVYDPLNGNFHFQTFLQQGANNFVITANNPYGTGSQGVTVYFNDPNYNANGGGNGGNYNYSTNQGTGNGGGNYQNNQINPNANVAPNGGGNYQNNQINPNINVAPNGGGNYQNNQINPNVNVAPHGGVNNQINPNANIAPNGGGNNQNNQINPNANIAPNGGGNNPYGGVNPNINGGIVPVGNGGGNYGQGKPFIQYINPSSSPINITGSSYNVSASVMNITNASQITINVNGSIVSSFNFNPSTHSLNFTAAGLLTGFNSVHISATNAVGSDSKSTVIDYKPTVSAPPRIAIFNPATSPFSSLQQNFIVLGYVYNVTSSSEITATFNGSPISFSYNQSTQEIEVPLNLSGSTNQLVINANNPSGTDTKQVNLLFVTKNCSPSNTITNTNVQGGTIQPTGGVIQANGNNNNTNNNPHVGQLNPNMQIGGAIQSNGNNNNNNTPHTGQQNPNMQTSGGVTYIDQQMSNSNSTPHTGQQNPNMQTPGGVTYIDQHLNNTSNSGGTTNNLGGVHHAPEVTRTSPGSSPYTSMSGVISAGANVNYVTNASEVSVTYNGSPVSFSFNPQISEALNFTSPLSPGMNTFVVKATNAYGSATQDISINYVPTNTSGNANGNPNLHFSSGTNVASNTPRELNVNNTPQRNEPAKVNTTPVKPIQQNNIKEGNGIRPR